MSIEIEEFREKLELQVYKGIPNQSPQNKKSSWCKFKDFFLPWLREKHNQGERYLEAQIKKIEAENNKTNAEALKLITEANLNNERSKEIASSIKFRELEFLEKKKNNYTTEELIAQRENIADKIMAASAIYGTKIDIREKIENSEGVSQTDAITTSNSDK